MDPDELQEEHMTPQKAWALADKNSWTAYQQAKTRGATDGAACSVASAVRADTFKRLMDQQREKEDGQ